MNPKEIGGSCVFDKLFIKNVPHIMEKIFFPLDYESFKNCLAVNNTWHKLLLSKLNQKKIRSTFRLDIRNDEYKLWSGNEKEVRRLLETPASGMLDVNCTRGRDETTPLCEAAKKGNKDVVQLLVDGKAELNKVDTFGETPLYKAAKKGHTEVVKILLDQGAVDKGLTPLCSAARMGRSDVVKLFLGGGADFNIADKYRETPLYRAAKEGHTEVVKLLLNQDDKGGTPLYWAARMGHHEVVKMLLAAGENFAKSAEYGETAVNAAARSGHNDAVETLTVETEPPLLRALWRGLWSGMWSYPS